MNNLLKPAIAIAAALFSVSATATVLPMTDFENGTLSGWHIGTRGDGSIALSVGAEADGNRYLEYDASGGPDDESRIALMAGDEYLGNWNQKGIKSLSVRMKNNSTKTLTMHTSFGNSYSDLRTRYATAGVDVVNDGQWHDVVFSLTNDMHLVSKGGHGKSSADFTVAEAMGNVVGLRFTHGVFGEVYTARRGPFEGYNAGESLTAQLWIDDIQFSTDAYASSVALNEVSAVPVPAAAWLFTSALAGLAVSRKRAA